MIISNDRHGEQCNGKCPQCCNELNIMKGNLKPYNVRVETIVLATSRDEALSIASDSIVHEFQNLNLTAAVELTEANATPDDLRTIPWGQETTFDVADIFKLRRLYASGKNFV